MSTNKTKIVLLDDHPIVVDGLKNLLINSDPNYEVYTFHNARTFQEFIQQQQVHIVLLDINLPDGNGLDLCAELKKKQPNVKVIAFSNLTEQSIIRQMFDNGASGYLLKSSSAEKILSSLQEVLRDEIVMDQEVMRILTAATQSNTYPSLTTREKQIVNLLAEGKTTTAIADTLFLSKFTVDTYRKNLLQKFKVKNTTALLMLITKENLA